MAEKVLMFALSPTMETGTIAKWHKSEGDVVKSGEILCEVETDKAVMDYESTQEGILLKIVLPEGGAAPVGETIAILGHAGEDITALLTAKETPAEPPRPTPPAATPAPQAIPSAQPETITAAPEGRLKISPLAGKMAQESGLELQRIAGSGPGGRIVKRDIETALAAKVHPAAAEVAAPIVAPVAPVAPAAGAEVIKVSQKRKIIAKRLAESMNSAPHYYLKITVTLDDLLRARQALNVGRSKSVTLNAFLLKFVAEALKRHPIINSSWQGDTIIRHARLDIGLAVAQPDGLITPVVRDCGQKGILAIDDDLRDLIQKAQNNRLEPEEYSGATFTVSNLGSFGIQEFTAIINPPGSAILAIGEIRKEPVVGDDDQLRIASRMTLTLSCDHRVIDGAVGAAFLKELKAMLEHPIRTLY